MQVIYAEEYERPDFSDMVHEVWSLIQKYGHITNIYCDAVNPVVWQALKREFNEPYNEQYMKDAIADCKKFNTPIENRMLVVPVPFSTEGKGMLQHAKWLLDEKDADGTSLVAIHRERFQPLIIALRTAVATEYKLDKTQT